MFELALKARMPIIGVSTDDLVNLESVLAHYNGGKKVIRLPKAQKNPIGGFLYWTQEEETVTPDLYVHLRETNGVLVCVNASERSDLIFDAGVLPIPEPLLIATLEEVIPPADIPALALVLRGLSIKAVQEILMLTEARAGNALPMEVRRTRSSLYGSSQGLHLEDTSYDFYVWPDKFKAWMDLNKSFFHKAVHAKLVPRGVMLEGPPGVGKSMGAKAIANELGVPLYRMDVSSSLDKYIGVSEGKIAKILSLVDRESPCVLLIDEVEKIFSGGSDGGGTTSRILSQLLWWLAEHQSRVFVVMTTNDKSAIPPELYRKGRVDAVFQIPQLEMISAKLFAHKVYTSVMGDEPTVKVLSVLAQSVAGCVNTKADGRVSHSEVAEVVYNEIKKNGWA